MTHEYITYNPKRIWGVWKVQRVEINDEQLWCAWPESKRSFHAFNTWAERMSHELFFLDKEPS